MVVPPFGHLPVVVECWVILDPMHSDPLRINREFVAILMSVIMHICISGLPSRDNKPNPRTVLDPICKID